MAGTTDGGGGGVVIESRQTQVWVLAELCCVQYVFLVCVKQLLPRGSMLCFVWSGAAAALVGATGTRGLAQCCTALGAKTCSQPAITQPARISQLQHNSAIVFPSG